MNFKENILKILETYSQNKNELFINTLNNIIFILCIRIFVVLNIFAIYSKNNSITSTFLKKSLDIELDIFEYNDILTNKKNNLNYEYLYSIFKENNISKYDITVDCLQKISNLFINLIYYFLNESIDNNSFSVNKLLDVLKKNNYFLFKFVVQKYKLSIN